MKIRFLFFTLFAATFILHAQTVTWFEPGENNTPAQQTNYDGPETGFATYYAAYLAGQPTAYGEVYRPGQLTASHAELPLGTILRVTRLDNRAAVNVRVNDRGGLCAGCVVVLSKRAADAIGLDQTGRSRVRIEKVGFSNWNPTPNNENTTSVATVRPANPATNSTLTRRSVDNEQPMAWEEDLRRSAAPSPITDPYAYQPATYNNVPRAPQATLGNNVYAQQNGVVAPNNGFSIPITQGAQPAIQQNIGVVRPNTVQSQAPTQSPVAYSRPPVAPTSPMVQQAVNRPNLAVMSPRAPAQPNNENFLSNREISPNAARLQARTPVVQSSPSESPVIYANTPSLNDQLTNRVVLPTENTAVPTYSVQVGAFGTRLNADRMVASLRSKGLNNAEVVTVDRGDTVINRVVIGEYASGATAQLAADQLKAAHDLSAVVVTLL